MTAYSKFETELTVRPDDVDLYQHVHSTRYMDYVVAARFEQMERCYGMPMKAFSERRLGWFMTAATMRFKRPLEMGERMIVRCWIERFTETGCALGFEIDKKSNGKRSFEGSCDYTLVDLATNRATPLPEDVKAKYSI